MELLRVSGAGFTYGAQTIFEDIHFCVAPGEVFCLLGPNGSGKTTLLECLLGVQKLKAGEVTIGDKNINTLTSREMAKEMAFVPQRHKRTFPYLVHEVVAMGRAAHIGLFGAPGRADEKIVRRVLAQLGISHLHDRPYTQLSGGECQLVIIARALTQQSKLLIMDEPTAHLDLHHQLRILETIAQLAREGEKAVIMASHSPNHGFFLDSRGARVTVALLKSGGFLATGHPRLRITPDTLQTLYGIRAGIGDFSITETEIIKQVVPMGTA